MFQVEGIGALSGLQGLSSHGSPLCVASIPAGVRQLWNFRGPQLDPRKEETMFSISYCLPWRNCMFGPLGPVSGSQPRIQGRQRMKPHGKSHTSVWGASCKLCFDSSRFPCAWLCSVLFQVTPPEVWIARRALYCASKWLNFLSDTFQSF